MQVQDFQQKAVQFVQAWDKKRKTRSTKQTVFNHLIEEIGELAREYVNQESRQEKYSKEKLENAVGDILIQLIMLAHLHHLDIEKVVRKIITEEQKLLQDNS